MKKYILTEKQFQKIIDNVILEEKSKKIYTIPGDDTWKYTVINNYWHTHKNSWPKNKWFKLRSSDKKFKKAVKILDKYFPDARYWEKVSGVPLKNTPSYKKSTKYKRSFNNNGLNVNKLTKS